MGLVVQKYGGSSVADAERHQARGQADRRDAARPATRWSWWCRRWATPPTSCIELAEQVSPLPPRRELDMLLTAGERISMALLAMAIANLGRRGAVVHRQPGRHHHRRGARQGPDHRGHAGPDPAGARRRARRDRRRASRASASTARTSRRSAAAARTPPRSRSRPRSAPTSARSTPTSTACTRPIRASCPTARKLEPDHLRGDARARGARREGAAAALRRVRAPLRRPDPRAVLVLAHEPGTIVVTVRWRTHDGAADHRGVAHDRSEAKITVVGVPDIPGKAAEIFRRWRRPASTST